MHDFETVLGGRAAGRIVGIDIGKTGALALLTAEGELVDVADMPTLDDGPKGRPAVNAALLVAKVREWRPTRAYVEYVGARPGEAPSGAFAFGRCKGVIEGVLAAEGVPARFLTPAAWKRTMGLPPGKLGAKDAARSAAIGRWPDRAMLFARAMDDGRADACLIGMAGIMQGRNPQ